jgi:hypothetical protein
MSAARLIAGLRALADFLQGHPDVPAPLWTDMYLFPPRGTDEQMRAEIDEIAARIGANATYFRCFRLPGVLSV